MASLHPRLAADTRALGETELCWLRWMNDQRFAWIIVVPKRDGLREWHHLPVDEQQALLAQVVWGSKPLAVAKFREAARSQAEAKCQGVAIFREVE